MDQVRPVTPQLLMIRAMQSAALEPNPWPTQALAESLSARMKPDELCTEVLGPAVYALGRTFSHGPDGPARALALLRLNALILLQQKRARSVVSAAEEALH